MLEVQPNFITYFVTGLAGDTKPLGVLDPEVVPFTFLLKVEDVVLAVLPLIGVLLGILEGVPSSGIETPLHTIQQQNPTKNERSNTF